jgi:hypothetical protein
VFGDFNTHSPAWSLNHSDPSPWEAELVNWFDEQGLYLLNPEGVHMWQSLRRNDSQRPSIIDLALLNEAAAITDQFSDLSISFNIIPSNHATLTLQWHPVLAVAIQPLPELVGYAIDDDRMIQWKKIFTAIILEPITSIPSLEAAATALYCDINLASSKVFSKWKAPDLQGVRWWNLICDATLSIIRISDGDNRTRAI